MTKRAALFVDCDFVRGYLGDEGKQLDYERLLHSDVTPVVQRSSLGKFFPDAFGSHYTALAFLSRPLGAGGLTLENFVARISGFGWRVQNYRINKMMDDKPMPAIIMARYADYYNDMDPDLRPLNIFITSDRAILPYIEDTGSADVLLIGPDHWAEDMMVKQIVSFLPMAQFCEALPHVISVRGQKTEEKIADEFILAGRHDEKVRVEDVIGRQRAEVKDAIGANDEG